MTAASEEQIGLALSGGGFRASLFHLGGLWRLNEIGKLVEIDAISGVSGGALVAGVLGTRWERLRFNNCQADNFRDEVAEPVFQLCSRNIDVASSFAGLFADFFAGPTALEKRYEDLLVGKHTLQQLPSHPRFIFNACHLETESNWTFSREGVDTGEFGRVEQTDIPLAKVLAASSALPPALPPVRLPLPGFDATGEERPGSVLKPVPGTATLADAGLCDSLGLHAIRHMKHLLVSDGTKSFRRSDIPPWEVWTSRITNPMHTALEQNRNLRMEQLTADIERGEKSGVVWALRNDPRDDRELLSFPVRPGWTSYIRSMRTRMAAFTDEEKMRLVNWGYIQCDLAVGAAGLNNVPHPSELPFPDYGFDREPERKRKSGRNRDHRKLKTRGRPASG
ncbi:MAG: patatin-like phospholipase family protein [Chloroflexi bacterium]|nr:patatin-like phospholipase family protein [Chloroflexota bacterium]